MKVIQVIIKPNAPRTEITEENGIFKIALKAKPEDGKANQELIKLLSKHFKEEIKIISGKSSSKKLVRIG